MLMLGVCPPDIWVLTTQVQYANLCLAIAIVLFTKVFILFKGLFIIYCQAVRFVEGQSLFTKTIGGHTFFGKAIWISVFQKILILSYFSFLKGLKFRLERPIKRHVLGNHWLFNKLICGCQFFGKLIWEGRQLWAAPNLLYTCIQYVEYILYLLYFVS